MRLIVVWLVALASIAVTTIVWVAVAPAYYEVRTELNETIGAEMEDLAKETWNKLWTGTEMIYGVAGAALILFTVLWALLSMQREERVTGYY